MKEIGCLVPVDPHAAKIVAQKVVKRVARQETQTVGNPVSLARGIKVIRFCAPTEIPDGLCTLVVGTRPDTKSNAVQCVGRVLLKNKRVVHAVRLAAASADLNIMGEARL